MAESVQQASVQALMSEMGLAEQNIERRRRLVGLDASDLTRSAAIKEEVSRHVEEHTKVFFDHLSTLEEAKVLTSNRGLLERARNMKRDHLLAMVHGEYDKRYVEQRIELAMIYSRVGLEARVFLAAFHQLLKHIGTSVLKSSERSPLDSFESFMSLKKVAFFDIGVIVDVLVFER